MPAPIEPPELARLVDLAERSRVGDWSLRSALCRYASPQPGQVRDVLELVRRIDAVLHPQMKALDQEGPALWAALEAGDLSGPQAPLLGLLDAMAELDRLGDVLAEWADDRRGHEPQPVVEAALADVGARLEALGVPYEERVRPPRAGERGTKT